MLPSQVSAVEASAGVTPQVPSGRGCHNCGTPLHGPFCSQCGQEDRPLDPTLRDVLRDAAHEISSFDSRILRSVRRLFLYPGFLTREYLEGRRAAWVSPVRLYLTCSVAYFAIAALAGVAPLSVDVGVTGADDAETIAEIQRLGFANEAELQRAVDTAIADWMPRAMFVLVPGFGWLVSRVRPRAGRHYPQHLIFALHVFAASFGVQALARLPALITESVAVSAALGVAGLLYTFTYTAVALRNVYGGSVGRGVRDGLIVLFFYWLATAAVAALIVLPVLFWR